jgi:membrane-associated phospholipid phosphatase
VLGLGELPTVRLQRALGRGAPGRTQWRALDHVLVWTHWSWFMVPHGSIVYLLLRHPDRFPRGAALMYTVFNVGASFYWVIPTAPPWYAAGVAERTGTPAGAGSPNGAGRAQVGITAATSAAHGDTPAAAAEVRRLMVEYGEDFWRGRWGSLYSVFGGNPLAAMPSLHFATSLMAAFLLAEAGPVPGALGTAYTATLGFSLVYLGEHYVADLIAGAALTLAVRRVAPRVAAPAAALARGIGVLEAIANPA